MSNHGRRTRSKSSSPHKLHKTPRSQVQDQRDYRDTMTPGGGVYQGSLYQYPPAGQYVPQHSDEYYQVPPPPPPQLRSQQTHPANPNDPSWNLSIPAQPWLNEFRPRWPSDGGDRVVPDPIPQCYSVEHAILIRDALTKFHLAVYLADEDAGESEERMMAHLEVICNQYMAAMSTLGIQKHQIVFFYHGRGYTRTGNQVWDAISEWEANASKDGKPRSYNRYPKHGQNVSRQKNNDERQVRRTRWTYDEDDWNGGDQKW
ncbi:hypothetical protein LTS08_007571 [Lithohypha guttulata]|nr:hypothetical protein LTS08_007571 [Lithohypha guttulata]